MLNSYREINITLSRSISLGQRAKVVHEDAGTGAKNIILDDFPENVATAFCKDLMSQRVKPHGKAILVTGATPEAYIAIFEWMKACAQLKKVLPFPKFPNYILYRATRVAAAAEILGLRQLVEGMNNRMKSIAKGQIHTDDVWMIYKDPDCAQHKDMVAKSLAQFIIKSPDKVHKSLHRLRREMPNVNDDIKYAIDSEYLEE